MHKLIEISSFHYLNFIQKDLLFYITSEKMTSAFHQQQFINLCAKGNTDLAEKKLKKDNVDINCKQRQTLNTAAHVAALNDQLQVLRMLAQRGFNFRGGQDLCNSQGNTPLHLACEKPNLQIILFLLMNESDYAIKNKKGYKPGQNTLDARIFLSSALIPQQKAFTVLNHEQKIKLIEIFNDIDFDDLKAIDLHKAVRFNKYIQQNIPQAKAQKDANDFLKASALCNKHSVNIDQWLFAFAKLYVCDSEEFNKFLQDYDAAVQLQGKLKSINI